MDVFFRKIRHRLLSENKISKYLIYAIGEIILVVIGILIALYINNLNTEKQDAITLNGYLNNIAENIKSDQINLEKISDQNVFWCRLEEEIQSHTTSP